MLRSPELQPNAENATPEELRVAMEAAPNKRSYVRLCAMRALLMKSLQKSCFEKGGVMVGAKSAKSSHSAARFINFVLIHWFNALFVLGFSHAPCLSKIRASLFRL